MSTKIQINSVEALERLIGGDTDVEIQLRGAIVQEFAKRHLKHVLTQEMIEDIRKDVIPELKAIQSEVRKEIFQNTHSLGGNTVLTPVMKQRIKDECVSSVNIATREIVDELIEYQTFSKRINNLIDQTEEFFKGLLNEKALEGKVQGWFNEFMKRQFGK